MLPKNKALLLALLMSGSVLVFVPAVDAASTCTITSPTNGDVFQEDDADFTFSASTDGSKVTFGVNSFSNDNTDFSAPFQYQKSPGDLNFGTNDLHAVCDDGEVDEVEATSITVTVQKTAPAQTIFDWEIRGENTLVLYATTSQNHNFRVYGNNTFLYEQAGSGGAATETFTVTNATADTETCWTVKAYGGHSFYNDEEGPASNSVCLTPTAGGGGPTDFVDNPTGTTLFDVVTGAGSTNGNRYEGDMEIDGDKFWIGKTLSGTATTTSVEFDAQWLDASGSSTLTVVVSRQNVGVTDGVREGAEHNSVGAILIPISGDEVQVTLFKEVNGVYTPLANTETGDSILTRHKYTLHVDFDNGIISVRDSSGFLINTASVPTGGVVYSQWYKMEPFNDDETLYLFRDSGSTTIDDAIITSLNDPPSAPQSLNTTPLPQAINVTWTAPADNGGEAVTQYTVYFDDVNKGTVPASQLYAVLTNIFDQDQHWINVTASNGAGEGPSASVQGNAGAPPPSPINFCDNSSGATAFNTISSLNPATNGGIYLFDNNEANYGYLGADLLGSDNVYTASARIKSVAGNPVATLFLSTNSTAPSDSNGNSAVNLDDSWTEGVFGSIYETAGNKWGFRVGHIVDGTPYTLDDYPSVTFNALVSTEFNLFYDGANGTVELQTGSGVALATGATNRSGNVYGYWFTDKFVDTTGDSGDSLELSRTDLCATAGGSAGTAIVAPSAPQNLAGTPGAQSVQLAWDVPASNGGEAIIQYRVWRDGNLHVELPGNQLTTTVDGLPAGVSVSFAVQARNSAGYGPNATVSATPSEPEPIPGLGDVPGVPQRVIAWSPSAGPSTAHFAASWLPPEGSAVLHNTEPYYWRLLSGPTTVYEGTEGDLSMVQLLSFPTFSFDDEICIQVAAQGVDGASLRGNFTEPVCLTTVEGQDQLNQAPVGEIAMPDDGAVFMVGDTPTATLDVVDTDGTISEVAWVVDGSGATGVNLISFVDPYTFTIPTDTVGVHNLIARVRDNQGGELFLGIQYDVVDETAGSKPSRVTNLTNAQVPGGYNLTWNAPSSDGGDAIFNYRVYREIGGVYRIQVILDPGVIGFGNTTTYAYIDTDATNFENYCWSVTAVNAFGESSFQITCVEGDPDDDGGGGAGGGSGQGGAGPFDLSDAAENSGIGVAALGWIMATILTISLAGGLAFLVNGSVAPYMGTFGILAGLGLSYAFGWIPVWFIVLLALLGAGAVFLGVRAKAGGGE